MGQDDYIWIISFYIIDNERARLAFYDLNDSAMKINKWRERVMLEVLIFVNIIIHHHYFYDYPLYYLDCVLHVTEAIIEITYIK